MMADDNLTDLEQLLADLGRPKSVQASKKTRSSVVNLNELEALMTDLADSTSPAPKPATTKPTPAMVPTPPPERPAPHPEPARHAVSVSAEVDDLDDIMNALNGTHDGYSASQTSQPYQARSTPSPPPAAPAYQAPPQRMSTVSTTTIDELEELLNDASIMPQKTQQQPAPAPVKAAPAPPAPTPAPAPAPANRQSSAIDELEDLLNGLEDAPTKAPARGSRIVTPNTSGSRIQPSAPTPSYNTNGFGGGSRIQPSQPAYGGGAQPAYGGGAQPAYGGGAQPAFGGGNSRIREPYQPPAAPVAQAPYQPPAPAPSYAAANSQPAFGGGAQPAFGGGNSRIQGSQPAYGGSQPSYGGSQPAYGGSQPAFGGGAQPPFGGGNSRIQPAAPKPAASTNNYNNYGGNNYQQQAPFRPTPKSHSDNLDMLLGDLQKQLIAEPDPSSPATNGTCGSCGKVILGEVITALGNRYHPEHFVCSNCQYPLGTSNFYEQDGAPHCEKCYQELLCARCAHCDEPILDRCITAMGKKWHVDHFVCTQCNSPFKDGSFFERDGRPFCEGCFSNAFAPRCGGCNQPVKGPCINAIGQAWHPEHFVCQYCQKAFQGSFFEFGGKPYCDLHYHQQTGSLCGGCSKAITGKCVDALGKKWHPEHFVCAFCMNQLQAGSFTENSNKAYCRDCHSKLFG